MIPGQFLPENIIDKVHFRKPMAEELSDLGFHAADMHFHTNHSDSHTRVGAALTRAKRKGIGIAITDHNTMTGVVEAEKNSEKVMIVPGIEVSASDGPHILLYFYTVGELREFYQRDLEKKIGKSPFLATSLSTLDILEMTDRYNCVRAPAHPYGYLLFNRGVAKCVENDYLDEGVYSRFEAIEVLSGGMTRQGNLKAANLALSCNLGILGGSDGHLLKDLGGVLTCTESETIEGFLEDIVHQRSFVMGKEKNLMDKGVMSMVVLTKYLRYTIPSLSVHFRQNAPRVRRFMERRIKTDR
jgi:hypothetical protein